ncbi:MAG: hypothetical protein WCF84_02405 [Anaerolineae bacterium]
MSATTRCPICNRNITRMRAHYAVCSTSQEGQRILELQERVKALEADNVKLRAVVAAARAFDATSFVSDHRRMSDALAALEGEEQP